MAFHIQRRQQTPGTSYCPFKPLWTSPIISLGCTTHDGPFRTSLGYLVKPHLLDWRIFWRPGNLNLARRRASTAVGRWLSLERMEMMICQHNGGVQQKRRRNRMKLEPGISADNRRLRNDPVNNAIQEHDQHSEGQINCPG